MGVVHLVTDEDLNRQIAMKDMREDEAEEREHRLYFTMKLVQGRTLVTSCIGG